MRPSVVQRRNTNINREKGERERESTVRHERLGTRIFPSVPTSNLSISETLEKDFAKGNPSTRS